MMKRLAWWMREELWILFLLTVASLMTLSLILHPKLMKYGLVKQTVRWSENCLTALLKGFVISKVHGGQLLVVYPKCL